MNCVVGCVRRDRSLTWSLKGSLWNSWMLSLPSEWRTGKTRASRETANAPSSWCQCSWQLTPPAGTAGGQTAGAPTKWAQLCWIINTWSSRSSSPRRWPLSLTMTTACGDRYTVNWHRFSGSDTARPHPSHLGRRSGTSENICLGPDVDTVQPHTF